MSANLMSTMYSLEQLPWHKNAYVSTVPMGAVEAGSVIEGVFYEKRPVQIMVNNVMQEGKDFAIIRSPIPSDPQEVALGFVKKNYKILQPIDVMESFDLNVNQPVETLGFLGNGEKLFLTWKLPGFDVNGDEIILFGFVAVGYDGKFGASLYVVSVRVVCANTYVMAVSEGEMNNYQLTGKGKVYSGRHNSSNLGMELGAWMAHVQERALRHSESASVLFNTMCGKAIRNSVSLNNLLTKIYPDPTPLPDDYPAILRESREQRYVLALEKATRDREVVTRLYSGEGIAITGNTGWDLFNAVTQYENHFRVTKKPSSYSVLFGNRADTMTIAANTIVEWARSK